MIAIKAALQAFNGTPPQTTHHRVNLRAQRNNEALCHSEICSSADAAENGSPAAIAATASACIEDLI